MKNAVNKLIRTWAKRTLWAIGWVLDVVVIIAVDDNPSLYSEEPSLMDDVAGDLWGPGPVNYRTR